MQTEVIILAQANIGEAYVKAIEKIYASKVTNFNAINIDYNESPSVYIDAIVRKLTHPAYNADTLILTDLYGSTPNNIAFSVQKKCSDRNIRVISGTNLPMLIAIINHLDMPLNQLADMIVNCGKQGIIDDQHKPFE
jgi:mannose PTS system EIIA component